MRLLVKERLRVVLPVNLNEQPSKLFQNGYRNRRIVDAAEIASVRVNVTADQKLIGIIRYFVRFKPRLLRNIAENGADRRAVASGTDQIAEGAFAENRGDRVNNDGLARAGFAG